MSANSSFSVVDLMVTLVQLKLSAVMEAHTITKIACTSLRLYLYIYN